VLSGPSTGVVGAQVTARLAGAHDIITFDMGGTSTDVALLQGGEARLAREAVIHGYPIKAPMLDIHTVGAGGGSIAFVDSGGLLKVGPRSAGADPGPACYDRGSDGTTPAITLWSRSVARDRCTPRGSRPNWRLTACWCRATPAFFVQWACFWRICAPLSQPHGYWGCLRRQLARSRGSSPNCAGAASGGLPRGALKRTPGASRSRSICAMPVRIMSFPYRCPTA